MKSIGFLSILLVASRAYAGLFGELNLFYNTDTFATDTTSTSSKTFYALDIYANLESKHYLFAGFHVDQVNLQESPSGTQTSFSSQNMGPMFLWLIDKRKTYSFAAGYNLVAKGSYNNGTQTETLAGTGIFATIAAMPEVAENFFIGIKLNYYSLSYPKSTVDTTTTDVSYSRTLIFPSISMAWRN